MFRVDGLRTVNVSCLVVHYCGVWCDGWRVECYFERRRENEEFSEHILDLPSDFLG